jgi:RHH-type proline utilization regulon transcriptional repressor/proline dehydrogenase/delta 1-pyrroline-5-carboxylate dehydrogenase
VKGAYWDSEIKRAQELGVEAYPVFADKGATDLSYVACAKRLLQHSDCVFSQFATHNPVTLACVIALSEELEAPFECQRLHGMGQGLDSALKKACPALPVRVYAPVGGRQELLAYLVRRLLENGASSSYVRQAARSSDAEALLADAFSFLDADATSLRLPLPMELHMPERRTARGYDLGDPLALAAISKDVEAEPRDWRAAPLIGGRPAQEGTANPVRAPARPDVVIGRVTEATVEDARAAIGIAHRAHAAWDATDVQRRAAILDRLAALMEADAARLMALCV